MQRYGAGLANGKDSQGHIVNQIAPVADADAGYGTNSEPYSAYLCWNKPWQRYGTAGIK